MSGGRLRCCDVDAEGGPLEVRADDWDGISVWVGGIPSCGVCGGTASTGGGSKHAARPSAELFSGEWQLVDGLREHLGTFGDGLSKLEDPVVSFQPVTGLSWALMSFRRRDDAEALLAAGLAGWVPEDTGRPCEGLLLKRALPAAQVKTELEQAEASQRKRYEAVELAVARIYAWLEKTGQTLEQLFTNIDTDSSGDFDEDEFRAGMLSIGLTFDNETIKAMFSYLDLDGGGSVETAEFIANMQRFEHLMEESATSVLIALCLHKDKTKDNFKDLLARVGKEVSLVAGLESTVHAKELHGALVAVGIKSSEATIHDMAAQLGIKDTQDGVSLFELTERLTIYRKRRRHTVAKILHQCSGYLRKTGQSAVRIFTKCSGDGSGELDVLELNEAMRRMGQTLSPDTAAELMAELDLDGDGTIHVNEFLDKVRQAINERAGDAKRCKQLFDRGDVDGSGFLDEKEIVYVASVMGLEKQVADPSFVQQMMREMRTLIPDSGSGSGGSAEERARPDGEISYEEFLQWFHEIGSTYLERPSYASSVDLTAPSENDLAAMFKKIDADGSGSIDFAEVHEALTEIWPYMDERGFRRAFQAADDDDSNEVELAEFVQLVKFTVWLNDNRHRIQELEDAFNAAGGQVGASEFHYGNTSLGLGGSEGNSRYLFETQCEKSGLDPKEDALSFEQYVTWAVLHACVASTQEESEDEAQARRNKIMQIELASMAGEYGDLHFQDLAGVMISGGGNSSDESELRRRFKGVVRTVIELSELVRKGFASSRARNDTFPDLPDAIIRKLTQVCYKEEYFSGQNIITQGEKDGTYYVLRRGRVDVILDEHRVGGLEYGSGFGEIGLLLGTKRTATVTCVTPCEVYALDRADYETIIALLPKDSRVGQLGSALQNFWSLMTNPRDGSRAEAVDYKTYLNAHVRTSKTLTSNSDAEDFDEYEERSVAQSDWAEDCERYHLKLTDVLDKTTYFSSMYQLVELWSEDCHLSYATFLVWVLDNIAKWNEEEQCYVFKDVRDVEAVGDKFEKLKEEAREAQAAEEAKEAAALAAAEEKRQQAANEAQERANLAAAATKKKEVALAKIRAFATTMKALGGESGALRSKLNALDDEEAELLRRLASGELTPEEEAAVRARLAAIAAERKALEAGLADNRLQSEIAELDRKLAALDDEEAELLRRLAAGNLSPEEEAEIRKRLAEIAAEREVLLQQRAAKVSEQLDAAGDVRKLELASKLAAIDQKLAALDDEEAELLRRLAAGDLTPEEEAAIRKRLAEIAAEREALLQERASVVAAQHAANAAQRKMQAAAEEAELKRKLAALDDEEAELLRRLAAGDLSPEEEAAIRKRLAEIEAERAALQAKLRQSQAEGAIAGIDERLSALDDEEAELLRRLAAGNLTPEEEAAIRKRLAEIAAERQQLLEQQMAAMKDKLSALDDEEAELLRRLAAGNLTPEEEAAIRKRLAEIEAERKALQGKMEMQQARAAAERSKSELDDLKRKLAALDDEEAELLRRLAAGDLTPEEEAAIRKRLAEIAAEREGLQAQLHDAEIRARKAEMADIDKRLAALDDEEAELLRRLAAGDLTPEEEAAIRKRLAEIAAEREALLQKRAVAAEQLEKAEDAAAEAAAALANKRPETPVGPLGGRPIYPSPCPPADNPVWTPNTKSSWAFNSRQRGASRNTMITRARGGMNPLGEVTKRSKVVSCRHCLHGLCPTCRKMVTDQVEDKKRTTQRLWREEARAQRDSVRLSGTVSAPPALRGLSPDPVGFSGRGSAGFPTLSPTRSSPAVGRKLLLPPLEGREGAIVLESRVGTRALTSPSRTASYDAAAAAAVAVENREQRKAAIAQLRESPAKSSPPPVRQR